MNLVQAAILVSLVLHVFPVAATLRKHRVGLVWVGITLIALGSAAYLACLYQIVRLGPDQGALSWIRLLAACGVPLLLSGFFFSAILGRANASESLRGVSGTFALLLLFGVSALVFLREPIFFSDYTWRAGAGLISVGLLGKAYLGYLVVGVVLIGRNMEGTYRLARRETQQRLQPLLLGAFGVVGFSAYILSVSLWRGVIEVDNLLATLVPLGVANMLVSLGIMRGALTEATVPVSRSIVYSSVTAVAAALYAVVVATAAQLAGLIGWSPGQVATVSFIFIVILAGAAVFLSDDFQRNLRRFIDLNFYLDRYDYRTQWSRVTRSLDPTDGELGVLRSAESLFRDVFLADAVSIALRDAGGTLRPVVGKGAEDATALLTAESPLCRRMRDERRALLIDRTLTLADDFPASAELEEWRRRTAAQIVAPLLVGSDFLGVVGLERERHEDRFSFEDLDLMTNMAAQVATVLRSVQLGRELATAREVELLSQWSRMILHDLKNYLSPLRLIVQNMRVYMGNPEFQRDAVEDLASVANRMETLIKRLSDLRAGKLWAGEVVDLNEVVTETLDRQKLDLRRSLTVETTLAADVRVHGDAIMLQSVVENLVTNAVDAMEGKGRLLVRTASEARPGKEEPGFVLEISDEGPGIRPEFVRDRLFRPFSTTKRGGWGLGLYQVRSIVEAHGGEIVVESTPGEGTLFRVHLPGTRSKAPHPDWKIAASIPEAGRRGPWGR